MKTLSLADWNRWAQRRIDVILNAIQKFPALARFNSEKDWKVDVTLVGASKMTRLNSQYRGKSYPTDVLSFPSAKVFWNSGFLGELVICLPTLIAQAKEWNHPPQVELDILMTHGILHLLGLDHEKSVIRAREMARWEEKILKVVLKRSDFEGLIGRSGVRSSHV
jgi:probable rRNA maturation factor